MKLVYVMDPLCGWCYGNALNTGKLFTEFRNEIDFEIFPAGMWVGNHVIKQAPYLANYFIENDAQIAQRTGIDPEKAILFALEVQRARYVYGKDLNIEQTYTSICEMFQIDSNEFLKRFFSDQMKEKTQETFVMASGFTSSYSTLLMEKDGKYHLIEQGYADYSDIVEKINQLKK